MKNFSALLVFLIAFSAVAEKNSKRVDSVDELVKGTSSGDPNNQSELLASEVFISNTEEQALSHLHGLIKKYKGTSMEPELKFRLAELYMNRAKSARFITQIVSEEDGVASFLPAKIKSVKEKGMVQEAIREYNEIESRFPKYSNIDQVLFNKAFAQLQIDQTKEAEKTFITLLKTQKNSKLRPDAFLAVGEINFQARDFKKALAFYSYVKKFPEARVYPYGLYKSSWCYYNLKGYDQAIASLEAVIAFGVKVEQEGRDQRLDLRVEAIKDMALFYSSVKPAQEAATYFKNLAGDKDPVPALRKLSSIYETHGKDIQQSVILIDLIKNFPASEKLPFFHSDLAKNMDRQQKYKYAAVNLKLFYKTCQDVLKKEKKSADGMDFDEPCDENVRTLSKILSLRWLKAYQEKRAADPKLMALVSEVAMRVHLTGQEPNDENSKMRFLFAEHLFELNKKEEASQEYTKVADSTKDKERKHKSRYAAIVSYDQAYKSEFKNKTADQFRLLTENYLKDFPEGEHYLDVGFKLALFDYTNKNYKLAGPRFIELGNRFYKEDKGKKSQDLYLDILNSQKNYVEIQNYARKWKKTEADPKRQASLQDIFEQAFFSEVAILEEEKKYQAAVDRYKTFISENPTSDLIDEARWNKIDMHFKLKEYNTTAEGYIAFHELHPKHKNSIPGLVKAVEIYENMAEPERAFRVTEILKNSDPVNAQKWNFLSASYLKASARYEDAAKIFMGIYESPGDAKFKAAAKDEFFNLKDQLLLVSPWYQGKLKVLMNSPARDIASFAVRNTAINIYKSGNTTDLNSFVAKFKNNRVLDKSSIAILNKFDGEKREKEYFDIKISNASMDSIVSGVQKKTAKLDQVQAAYQKALVDEDPKVVVSSLIGLARTYQKFVEELKNLQPPASFSTEEADALKGELSNLIYPFEEKAAEAINQAVQVATDAEIKDGSLSQIKELFDKVNFDKKTIFPVSVNLPQPVGPRGYK